MRMQIQASVDSEGTKYERFKYDFEYLKLNLEYNNNLQSLPKFIDDFVNLIQNKYFNNQ